MAVIAGGIDARDGAHSPEQGTAARRFDPAGVSPTWRGMRMTRLALLTEADLRGALRLVNEARELPRSSPGQLHHVTRGLAAMTGAQVGIAGEMDSSCNIFPTLDFGWSGGAERGLFAAYAQGIVELPIDPVLPHLLRRSDLSVHTVHDHVKTLHRRLGVQSRGELLAIA